MSAFPLFKIMTGHENDISTNRDAHAYLYIHERSFPRDGSSASVTLCRFHKDAVLLEAYRFSHNFLSAFPEGI